MDEDLFSLILKGTGETLYMVLLSSLMALSLGLPLGIAMVITGKGHISHSPACNKILGTVINMTRSFPFIILIVLLLPLSRLLVGTTLGATAAIVPLSIGAAPFVARIIENALKEVDKGKIEAALAMGAASWEIILYILLPEALSSLVRGITLVVITITGFTATAGAIGAGGLGSLAIRYGYMRFRDDVMIVTVVLLVFLVHGIQWGGNWIADRIEKRRHTFG